jgi:hypothetical protein
MVCRYWWNNQEEERHHWISWKCLTKAKCEGGLGLRCVISTSLTWLCWPSRVGEFLRTLTLCAPEF